MATIENRETAIKFVMTMKDHRGFDEQLVTDDLQWFLPNQTSIPGVELKNLLKDAGQLMPEFPTMSILGVAAEGDRVAVEAAGKCLLTNGKRYDNFYHFVILFRDGRVCIVKEYCDSKPAADAGLLG
jgi:uncharacterized protein